MSNILDSVDKHDDYEVRKIKTATAARATTSSYYCKSKIPFQVVIGWVLFRQLIQFKHITAQVLIQIIEQYRVHVNATEVKSMHKNIEFMENKKYPQEVSENLKDKKHVVPTGLVPIKSVGTKPLPWLHHSIFW